MAWDDGMGGVNWAASVGPPIVDAALDPELPAVPGTALEAAESGAAASGAGMGTGERLLGAFVDGSAHAAGLLDVVGAAAASLAAIAVLLMVGRTRIGAAALHPLRMMGSMSLTVYVAHVVGFPVIDLAGLAVPAIAEVEPETWLIASPSPGKPVTGAARSRRSCTAPRNAPPASTCPLRGGPAGRRKAKSGRSRQRVNPP